MSPFSALCQTKNNVIFCLKNRKHISIPIYCKYRRFAIVALYPNANIFSISTQCLFFLYSLHSVFATYMSFSWQESSCFLHYYLLQYHRYYLLNNILLEGQFRSLRLLPLPPASYIFFHSLLLLLSSLPIILHYSKFKYTI